MNRLAGLVVAMALAAGGGWAREYPLVTGGKPAARIQMSPEPSAPEFRAAVELQDYIKKISGATVPRATYPPAYYRTVDQADFVELLLITPERGARLLPEKVAKRLAEASSGEAFYLFSEGDRIVLVGAPAQFEGRGMAIESRNIHLNRGTNRLLIDGAGAMTTRACAVP